jgi:hypothetical protein
MLTLGLVAAGIWWRHLRESKLLRLREMIHQERMSNVESNQSAETNGQAFDELLIDYASRDQRQRNPAAAVMWVRLIALCVGLAGLFGGIGMSVGMSAASDPDIHAVWSLGLIPATIGLGLLVFYYLSRNISVLPNGE